MEQIVVVSSEVVPVDLNIRTAMGTITLGYLLRMHLKNGGNGSEVTTDACNLCVTGEQSPQWCMDQCNRLAGELAEKEHFTPGEIMRFLHCGYGPLAELGVPVPPQKHDATMAEMREFHARTGRGMVYIENDLYREWAVAYNQWIGDHVDEALDFGCMFQDKNWIPVK
jgi:hypothetical protein